MKLSKLLRLHDMEERRVKARDRKDGCTSDHNCLLPAHRVSAGITTCGPDARRKALEAEWSCPACGATLSLDASEPVTTFCPECHVTVTITPPPAA